MTGGMEKHLGELLTVVEWLWLAGFGAVLLLALYVVGQFLKIVWRD
jgi:hypothetical protein